MENGLNVHNKIRNKEINNPGKEEFKSTNQININNNKEYSYNNDDQETQNEIIQDTNDNEVFKNSGDKSENDNFCYECYHAGNLICCDHCIRSYHLYCLSELNRPLTDYNYWYCPICKKNGVSMGVSYKRKKRLKTISTQEKKKEKVKQKTEGSNYTGQINVGDNYQVSNITTFFLNSNSETYEEENTSELVYSPHLLERMKECYLSEGQYELVLKNDYELAVFIKELAQNWKCQMGWYPFTPEYAFKILHRVDYNPKRAIELLKSSDFNFLDICDPPLRKYENKWRPRDKRGQISDTPFPSAELIQSYIKRTIEYSLEEKKYNHQINDKIKSYCEVNKNNIIGSSYPNERTRKAFKKEMGNGYEVEDDEDEKYENGDDEEQGCEGDNVEADEERCMVGEDTEIEYEEDNDEYFE
ncbi:phd finger protein, putative [Hepatocystis sp. ex Piliocolobus tephrosceles]|nr:phd finger protein, putative [Hepatocystis sp. ex Piliocolobus tephrosceles]